MAPSLFLLNHLDRRRCLGLGDPTPGSALGREKLGTMDTEHTLDSILTVASEALIWAPSTLADAA